jgi:hypothetical protein
MIRLVYAICVGAMRKSVIDRDVREARSGSGVRQRLARGRG